jgi:hypothetical protein
MDFLGLADVRPTSTSHSSSNSYALDVAMIHAQNPTANNLNVEHLNLDPQSRSKK